MSRHAAGRLAYGALLLGALAHAQDLPLQPAEHPRFSHSYPDPYEACYRYGRCSAQELQVLRERLQRADRLTPQAPEAPRIPMHRPAPAVSRDVAPTPEDQIRPEYRGASQWRDEYAPSKAR